MASVILGTCHFFLVSRCFLDRYDETMKMLLMTVIMIIAHSGFSHGYESCGHYNCHGAMCRSRCRSFHCSTDPAVHEYRKNYSAKRIVFRGMWNRWGANSKTMLNPYSECTYEAKKRRAALAKANSLK